MVSYQKALENNIFKIFLFSLTHRRNYITILSLYFLTLPNTTANQIGFYSGIANIAGFFFEIPSGYFADRFGHKKTLILAKILLAISTASFIFFQNFWGFALGMVCFTISIACVSGTKSAFMHETLTVLEKEKQYSQIMSAMLGKVSLISMIPIILLPFLAKISYLIPLYITLIGDILGILIAVSLTSPQVYKKIEEVDIKSIKTLFIESRKSNLLPLLVFSSVSLGFLIAESNFRYIYLEDLGYPLILVGFVMGLSRGVRYIFGKYSYLFEKYVNFKQHLIFEMILFPTVMILSAFLNNPYIIAGLITIMLGYLRGRKPIFQGYILNNYNIDKNYKATILSFNGQITLLFQSIGAFGLGYIMNYSYKLGYYSLGIFIFLGLSISYLFIFKKHTK